MRKGEKQAVVPDNEFIELFNTLGAYGTARKLGLNVRSIYKRREHLEDYYNIKLKNPQPGNTRVVEDHQAILTLKVKDGVVLIGSDAHIWPGDPSLAMRAFIKFCKKLKPAAVILNGDVLDFPQISRHPPIGHNRLPDLAFEIEEAQKQLHKIELGVNRNCKLLWTLGNHDSRFETRLATVAPEYAKLHGHSLKDHFPSWSPCWRVDINDDVVVKHRFKGGVHATHNGTLWAGKTTITGHLHSQKITPLTDLHGTRFGVDTGCLASTEAAAFIDYTEANPLNWRSGFCLLTFANGKLLPPELITVWDEKSVTFRGEILIA